MTRTFKGNIKTSSVGVLVNGVRQASLFEIDCICGPDAAGSVKPQFVSVNPNDNGFYSFGRQQFQTEQSNRSRARYQSDIAKAGTGQFGNRMDRSSKWFAHGRFFQRKLIRNT